MAYFDYGLNLELKNFQGFIEGAKSIDEKLDKLASSILSTASALDKIDSAGIKGKATALSSISLAYKKLGEATAAIDPNSISNVNKAISSGAQVKTIEGKAEAMEAFAKQAQKLSELPDLSASATQISAILTAFAGFGGSLGNFKDVDTIAGAISALASAFKKMEKISISTALAPSIAGIATALGDVVAQSKNTGAVFALVKALEVLFKALRTLGSGAEVKEIPSVLAATTTAINSLVGTLQGMNKNSYFGGDKIVSQIREIAIAFRDLGIAIRSYGGVKGTGFDNVEANIKKALDAFKTLVSAFQNTSFADDISKSVTPATQALVALGGAFETLGRKKGFEKFPDTIAKINEAITTLNVAALDVLADKISKSLPALRDLAELAKAVSIVNSQAGKAFVQAARDKDKDSESNNKLIISYQNLRAAMSAIVPIFGNIISSFGRLSSTVFNLIGPLSQLSVTLLKLPFNFVVAGFKALVSVIIAPFELLKRLGQQTLKVAHDLHLMQIGLIAIATPFKLIYSLISTVINVIISLASSITKLVGVFQIFSGVGNIIGSVFAKINNSFNSAISGFERLGAAFSKNSSQSEAVSTNIEKTSNTVKQSGTDAATTATKVENYSQTVNNAGKTAAAASGGVSNFSSSIGNSGANIEQAIDRLGRLQVTIVAVQKFMEGTKEVLHEVGSSLIEAGKSAFEAAAKFEQLQVSLNILGAREYIKNNPTEQFDGVLDAVPLVKENVDALIERFELLAITSPFTSDQISSGFQLAQIYGFTSEEAETLTNVLVDANAAISASGENISSIVLPLGQIKQLGKATLVDLKQVASAARLPVFEVLAEDLSKVTGKGVDVAEVMDLISAGMIDADFAINSVVNRLRGDFNGAASASSNTLEGIRSTFEDFRANTLRTFATPIIKAILFGKEEGDFGLASFLSMDNIIKKLEEAKEAGENLAVTVNRVFQTIVYFAQLAQAAINLIPEPVITIIKNFALLAGVAFAANLAFGILIEGIFVSVTVMGLFINTNTILIGSVIGLATVIVANYDAIKEAIVNVGQSVQQLPAFFSTLGQAFVNLFTNSNNVQTSFSGFNVILQNFANGFLSSVSTISRFGQAFNASFQQLLSGGKASIAVFAEFPSVLQIFGSEVFKILNVFATFGSKIASFPVTIGNVASTVSEIFSGLLGEFVTWGSNIIVSFAEGINNTIGLLSQALQAIGDMLAFWLAPGSPPKVAPDIDKWGELAALEFVEGFVSSFLEAANQAGTVIKNNFGTVVSGLGNAILTPLAAIGRAAVVLVGGTLANALAGVITVGNGIFEIISALFNGLSQQIGIVIITIIRVVEALAKPTKAFVTLQNIVQAFADGAKLSLQNFADTLKGVFSGVLSILGGVVAFINGQLLVGFLTIAQFSTKISDSLTDIGNGSRDFLGGVQTALQGAENFFADTLNNVAYYGSNIVQQFADGMLEAVNSVANALAEIGRQITYWLAPGSPPRLLPDIDKWGTAAANEFVGAFSEADLNSIGDFGDTIETLLKTIGVDGVDTEKIVEQFASGLIQNQQTGDFGAGNFEAIGQLAGEAAPEVVALAQKYAQLAAEQSRLNEVTRQYDAELQSVQGSLDDINRTEGIETNQAKVEALTNALSNKLLTQNERTRIQQQIQKLQAETRIKQLESEKKVLESNSSSTEEAIALQKKQLQLADKFDNKGTTAIGNDAASTSAGVDKAAKAQDRLSDAVLKYKLQTADTAGKIKIMKEELAKVKVGSEEYYEILTDISQLEAQLAREREQAAKGDSKTDALQNAYGDALSGDGGLTSLSETQEKIKETIDNAKKNFADLQTQVTDKFNKIKETVGGAWATIKGYLDLWILQNDTVKASIAAIAVVFAGVKIIGGISAIGSALALLSNPIVAVGAAIVALTAGLTFFVVSSGGIEGAISKIGDSFTTLQNAFTVGATTGQGISLDFSSFDMAIATLGINIGAAATNIGTGIINLFLNLGGYIQTGLTNLGNFFINGWNTFQTNLLGILSNFNILNTQLGTIATGVVNSLFTFFITPMSTAFSSSDTLLGGVTAAFIAFYDGVVALAIDLGNKLYTFLTDQDNKGVIANFFANTFIGQTLETNINEAVGNIVPALEGSFDLSTFIISIVQQFKALYSAVVEGAQGLYDAIIVPILDTFNSVKESLAGVIQQNSAAFSEFFSEIASPEFISGLKSIAEALGFVIGGILALAAAIIDAALIGILKNIADVVIEVGAGIDILKSAFAAFAAGDILGGIGKTFQGLTAIFDGVFGNIADAIADTVKALLEFIGIDTSGTLGVMIQFVADLVVQIFSFNKLFAIFGGLWNGVVFVFQKVAAIVPAILALFAGGGSSTSLWTRAIGFLYAQFNNLVSLLTKSPAAFFAIGKAIIEIPQEIVTVFEGFGPTISSFLSLVGTTIVDWVAGLGASISTGFSNLGTAIYNGIANAFSAINLYLYTLGYNILVTLAQGVLDNIVPSFIKIKTGLISGIGFIDLSQAAALFKGLIEGVFGFDTETIVANLTTKLSTTVDSAIAGITSVAFNIADAIYVSEEEQQKLSDNIKGYLPNFDTLFGEGTTDKVALNIADFITIDEAEVNGIKDVLVGVIDNLKKFSEILPLPEAFKTGLDNIKAILTGDLSLTDAVSNIYNHFVNIGLILGKAFANPFGIIQTAIDGLSNPITLVSEGFTSLKESISGLLEIDLSGFTSIFSPVTEAFTAIGEQITNLKSGIEVLNLIPGVNIGSADVTGADVARESIRNEIETKLADSPFSVETKIDFVTGEEDLALQSKKLIATFTESYAENTTLGITNFAEINRDLIEGGFTATDISALSEKFGLEVPAGLALGLQDTNGDLDRATTGLATNLLSQISEDLGIQSPSTKARDDIGIPFVQGIALGLEDYTVITTALGLITASMISTVTTALSEASLKINVAQSLFTLNEAAVQVTRLALENISNLHIETFGKISDETIPNFVSLTEEQFTNSFDTILGLLEEFAGEMITTIEDLSTDVIDSLGTMRNKIANLTSGFKNVGKDLGEALMEGIINAIEDQTDAVIGAVNALFGADGVESTTLLDKSKASGVKIGKAFTEGVAEGILAPTALAAIKQAVEEMIQQAEDAAKKAAGVESPSTLFRDSIGKNLTAGIGIGMMDGLDGLTDITKNIINSIYLLTKDEIGSQFTTGITDGIQSQQTALNTTVTNLLDNSVLAAKTQLQINSPSRVTNKSIGVPYVDGILTALEGGRGRLSNVAGSLLDVLPLNQTFKYNVEGQVAKQPVELQYSNLMTALPQLTQNVAFQGGNYQRNLGNAALALSGRNSLMSNTNMESVNMMTDSRSTSLSNYTVNNYEMTVMTTPERATRVEHNFDAMRLRRRI